MGKSLKSRIYKAQCIGNVEPIEYMTPYPSMRSLIEGQTIKFANQLLIEKSKITNQDFYKFVNQTSNWLEDSGVKPKQRIVLPILNFPQSEILLYGIWNLGAIAVLPCDIDINKIKRKCNAKQITIKDYDLFNKIEGYPKIHNPKYKPLLDDEAVLSFEKEFGILLSHYNLLINVNGVSKALELKSQTRYKCDLLPNTTSWIVLQAILPIYSGCVYAHSKPEMTIGLSGNHYNLRHDLTNIKNFSKTDIALCTENTAVLSIGKNPIHLTDYNIINNKLRIKGHSVMMGYLKNSQSESSFQNESLVITI